MKHGRSRPRFVRYGREDSWLMEMIYKLWCERLVKKGAKFVGSDGTSICRRSIDL